MAVSKTLLVFSALFLMLSYPLYSNVPAGIDEPWLQRTYIAGCRLAGWMAVGLEMVTGTPAVHYLRWQAESLFIPEVNERPGLDVKNLVFEGVPVRVYTPDSTSKDPRPCIVYFVGGGWSTFSIDSYDTVLKNLALGTDMIVIAVQYRRSPEHPFPVPFDDCVKATRHVLHHPDSVGVNPSRVAVGGDGSGGNLAAAVALRLSEEDPRHTPALKLQILLQPALQASVFDTPSYRQNAYNSILTRDLMLHSWLLYLGLKPQGDLMTTCIEKKHISSPIRLLHSLYLQESKLPDYTKDNYVERTETPSSGDFDREVAAKVEALVSNPFLAPLVAEDLSKVARAFIVVGEFDVLRDDGLFYAVRLQEANVKCDVVYVMKQGHGFLAPQLINSFLSFAEAEQVWKDTYLFLKRNL
ncbi:arylacetamide deacetylase [Aplysia californica]|uniref:Arylacetamide deacetylase n=1 Tax=Aplysia californica TaxID=6500 RepID=A0ABM0JDX2_APLCA|nr:arylacetamide deacetylase [Aplysia californica]